MSKRIKRVQKRPVLADKLRNGNLFNQTGDLNKSLKQTIQSNLKHQLRDYQWRAIINFNWSQTRRDANKKFNQVMFKMATGSGKTDLMAALILYLYATKGYHYFIYVTKSKGVVEKTKDNFIDSASDKYLFNPNHQINVNGLNIQVHEGLPDNLNMKPAIDSIYIDLTTINSLTSELNYGGDNKLSYVNFEGHKIVVLADEAHHFNAHTKDQTKSQSKYGHTWESTLDKLRNCDPENRQLEFTATLNYQEDDHLYDKYKNKIVYEYNLKKFVSQGFAKRIYRLETSDDDHIKMINAILLSQYRKDIAKKLNVPNFKPVILFKSNLVKDSHKSKKRFDNLISYHLDTESLLDELHRQIKVSHSSILTHYVYVYWIERLQHDLDTNKHTVINELKKNFSSNTIVDMNDSGSTDVLSDQDNFRRVNTLEDPNNPIRVIFAVAKLTEGWDVLNLYDIVRLKEHKKNVSTKDTDSEAQLIGRGSRYYPFKYHGRRAYHRRFDGLDMQHQILERIYYHTINDNRYLKKLDTSLDKEDVPVTDDNDVIPVTAHLKPGFKRSKVYRYGYLFQNKTTSRTTNDKSSLHDCGIPTDTRIVNIQMGTYEQKGFSNKSIDITNHIQPRKVIDSEVGRLSDDPQLVSKALSKLYRFFNFHNLHKYFPPLKSMQEFITSPRWLGSIKLIANVDNGSSWLTEQEKQKNYYRYRHHQLKAVVQYFQKQLWPEIHKSRNYRKGTNTFYFRRIKDLIPNSYTKDINKDESGNLVAKTRSHPMNQDGEGWFVYDNAIVDTLEYRCILQMSGFVKFLRSKGYYNIYLIRNDEQHTKLELHSFTEKIHPEGYMPDFILYACHHGKNRNVIYQVYVEPKGDQLTGEDHDAWKERLLQSIRPWKINPYPNVIHNATQNSLIKLYGVKFYTNVYEGIHIQHVDTHHMFDELHDLFTGKLDYDNTNKIKARKKLVKHINNKSQGGNSYLRSAVTQLNEARKEIKQLIKKSK